jgi:hypothetical protein
MEEQVEKAGADVLFKDPNMKSTDLGVTVTAIRIKRLEQLGDVKAAGERLLNAEKKKVLSCSHSALHLCIELESCFLVQTSYECISYLHWRAVIRQHTESLQASLALHEGLLAQNLSLRHMPSGPAILICLTGSLILEV